MADLYTDLRRRFAKGESVTALADETGITRERMRQLLTRPAGEGETSHIGAPHRGVRCGCGLRWSWHKGTDCEGAAERFEMQYEAAQDAYERSLDRGE